MKGKYFCLLIFAVISSVCASLTLTPEQVTLFGLSGKIPTDVDDLKVKKEKLEKRRKALNWLNTHKTPLIREELIEDAMKELQVQERELTIWEEVNSNLSTEIAIKAAVMEIIERKSGEIKESDVGTVKKWLMRCKSASTDSCPEDLYTKRQVSSAIEFLQRNTDLRTTLAAKVKVHRWPLNLNLGKEGSEEIIRKLDAIIKNLEEQNKFGEIKSSENKQEENKPEENKQEENKPSDKTDNNVNKIDLSSLIAETRLRRNLIEYFSFRDGNVESTTDELSHRVKAFGFLVTVRLHRLPTQTITEADLELVREWLLVHQTIYGIDGVSVSGGFTVDWPPPFPLSEYDPSIPATVNYFSAETAENMPADPALPETRSKMFPNLVDKLEKMKSTTTKALDVASNALTGAASIFSSFIGGGGGGNGNKKVDNVQTAESDVKNTITWGGYLFGKK